MRQFEERKAEVFARSHARIRARKQLVKTGSLLGVTVLVCAAVWVSSFRRPSPPVTDGGDGAMTATPTTASTSFADGSYRGGIEESITLPSFNKQAAMEVTYDLESYTVTNEREKDRIMNVLDNAMSDSGNIIPAASPDQPKDEAVFEPQSSMTIVVKGESEHVYTVVRYGVNNCVLSDQAHPLYYKISDEMYNELIEAVKEGQS